MTAGPPAPGRLSLRQLIGWGVAFAVVLALIILFFLFGRQVAPLVNGLPQGEWLKSWS